MKASLSNFRQPPRKVRLLADYIKGKPVKDALAELGFVGKKSSLPLKKLIASAVSNAGVSQKEADNLFIKSIRIDKGMVMKKHLPRAQGRATLLRRRTSHIAVELGEIVTGKSSVESVKKETKKKTTKAVSKTKEKKEESKKTTKPKQEKKLNKKNKD